MTSGIYKTGKNPKSRNGFKKGQNNNHWTEKTKQEQSIRMKGNTRGFKKGQVAWNKDLTKETDERVLKNCLPIIILRKSKEFRQKSRLRRQQEIIKNNTNIVCGKNEKQILDKLEQELNHKIIRQYPIYGYFLDGYIPELNLAIEIDEQYHFDNDGILRKKDVEREQDIKSILNCNFLRINEKEFLNNLKGGNK